MMRRNRELVKMNSLLHAAQRYIINPRIAGYLVRKLQRRQTSNRNLQQLDVFRNREALLDTCPRCCPAYRFGDYVQLRRGALARNTEPDTLVSSDAGSF